MLEVELLERTHRVLLRVAFALRSGHPAREVLQAVREGEAGGQRERRRQALCVAASTILARSSSRNSLKSILPLPVLSMLTIIRFTCTWQDCAWFGQPCH